MDEWRTINEFPLYEVSNTGYVRNKATNRLILGHITHKGYRQVGIFLNKKQTFRVVHRLVMIAFEGEIPTGMEVNHKDGNKLNNHVDNLEYVTHQENMIHAYMELGNPGKKLNKHLASEIRGLLRQSDDWQAIAKSYGVCWQMVHKIAQQLVWRDGSEKITHPSRKLTPDKVLEIKVRAANGEVHARIANDYGVSDSTVDYIANGKLWKSVVHPQKG